MKPVVLLCALAALALPARAQSLSKPHSIVGDVCIHARFHSRFLAADRDILVWLPPGYDANAPRRYPVLYLHDAQNLFDGGTAFLPGKEWRVDETATELIAAKTVVPLIIVGVNNAGGERMNEYTPTKDGKERGGGADAYGKMLTEELKPYIDRHYRTQTDAAHTALGGSSLGGLVSLYLGLQSPNVWGKVACLSTSAWWDNEAIVRQVNALTKKPRLEIWLDIGGAEGADAIEPVRHLRDALVAKGWKEGRDLGYLEDPGAQHNETAWAARFGRVLTFLFPAQDKNRREANPKP